ncbi:putative S-adenosyl-L-methionine-dependent methyltransferase [Nitzschia inconspicua]|uniref:type II protein arginine methyltransferase n=1 Tax=Nitzschia inconspicua TaxID=303405 RepID=A0A9K3M215_9STRA|nr:putative S-adenosyl-L-methionine-dependent methyltransferase [Nitzschia inconspicua]
MPTRIPLFRTSSSNILRRRLRPLWENGNIENSILANNLVNVDQSSNFGDGHRRFMATGKKSGKKEALQRQRDRSSDAAATDQSDSLTRDVSPSSPPTSSFKSFAAAPTLKSSAPSIITPDGLSQLNLQPDSNWSTAFDHNNYKAPDLSSWEPNKSNTKSLLHRDDLLLRSSNTDIKFKEDDIFEVDREAMFDPTIHLPHAPSDWKGYEAATPLSDFLMQRIGVSGQPITTAEYMRHALTHPLYGYYTSNRKQQLAALDEEDDWDDDEYDKDKSSTTSSTIFGRGGDFVTAPELTSVFGHSLCVWFMTVWQQGPLHKPPAIQMVEFGPGRGTLMADLLELAHSSKLMDFGKSIQSVHFIETSRELRKEQKETLQKVLGHLIRLEFADEEDNQREKDSDKSNESDVSNVVNTIQVVWHDDFASFQRNGKKEMPTMIILQEFLDALPVHQFQKTEDGWRERMIDVVSAEEEAVPLSKDKKELKPRLRQVLAPQVTPAVELLLSPNQEQYDHFPEGTVIEICPDALLLLQDIAMVLEESQGAALIVDYGEEGTSDTLRAFSKHKQVPLTSQPGMVDVTADVDFFALKNCLSSKALIRGSAGDKHESVSAVKELEIKTFGPVSQGEFLMKMGAGELTMNAIEKPETTEEQAQAMADALKYLVMPEHMGTKFKVLALARKRDGLFGPAGMER